MNTRSKWVGNVQAVWRAVAGWFRTHLPARTHPDQEGGGSAAFATAATTSRDGLHCLTKRPSEFWSCVGMKALAHVEMMRPYTMFHSGLLAIAGAELASGGLVAPWRVVCAALVTICGWEAGLYAGDYYDRDLDALSKPTRAIPSGRVSPREAFLTMVGLIACGYGAALVLGPANLALAVVTTVLGIAYSKTFKNQAILGNFDRGILGICAVLFGALAGGRLLAPAALIFALLIFFHDSASNLVGTIRDLEGDRAAGYATVPVVYGLVRAVEIVSLLALTWIGLAGVLGGLLPLNLVALLLISGGVALAILVYAPLWARRQTVTRAQALNAHKVLVVERLTLVSGFIAVFAPWWVAGSLLGGTAALTLASQVWLRDRYEPHMTASKVVQPAPR